MKLIADKRMQSGRVAFPQHGVWTAEATVFDQGDPTSLPFAEGSKQVITIDSFTFNGTVSSVTRIDPGRVALHLHAGAGGMSQFPKAKNYTGSNLKTIISDLLLQAGETLSPASDATTLSRRFAWQVFSDVPIGKQLFDLLAKAGSTWRSLPDGSVFVFPSASAATALELPTDAIKVDASSHGTVVYHVPNVDKLPQPNQFANNVTFNEVHVTFDSKSTYIKLYTITYESVFTEIFSRLRNRLELAAAYPCTVQAQNPDGSLHITPDDPSIRGNGMVRVPIRFGIPGTSATIPSQTRVWMSYDATDNSRPFVGGYMSADGGNFTITIGAPSAAKFLAQSDIVDSNFSALKQAYDTHTHPTGVGPSGVPVAPAPTPSPTACKRLKSQ